MLVHLGENVGVNSSDIIGIFDLESSTVKESTRDFLVNSEKESIVTYTSEKPSKTFVVVSGKEGNRVFLTQISSKTILERARKKNGSV